MASLGQSRSVPVSGGLKWSQMVSDGHRWSQIFSDDLYWLISSTIEWFKTPKPISGLDWMDLRVFRGIEHLTVLIKGLKKGLLGGKERV